MAQHPTRHTPNPGQPARRGLAGRIPSPGFETFGGIFGFIYTFLAGNVLMAFANAPLVLCLALVADPAAAWPFFLALSATIPPSLAGLFAAFQALHDDGAAVRPVASYLNGYRRGFRRSAPLGLAAVAALLFLGVDLVIVQSMPAAALLVPVIAAAAAITVSVTVTAIAGVVLLPHAGLKDLLKAALYLTVQRWYLSLATLVLLGIIATAALLQPVLGIALAPAPLLFVIWSNASYAYSAALRTAN
ncbi:hypothetical protein Achl_3569 [Pseudarthrobacter chlorophenolicus A6]|uniref:Uncharacterized protein n=1 Tax=Pseudarthrobacter chlorophenolicus (strain ATCC 700700 / DSM 12829 / CIP 107037 / JCM 12360 / KCTC 9906 / NCIMB 13794 / A6) TaxID=452863 RepID=B8H6J9_PSECP|nr:hypothetical protein Achl_3569 [Pseudarthrobacter chlorophenolicus A6]SDQ62660.1 hypothetical protein SAMN04489738_1908 [Pseudarthrobacter chlorophenolicus]